MPIVHPCNPPRRASSSGPLLCLSQHRGIHRCLGCEYQYLLHTPYLSIQASHKFYLLKGGQVGYEMNRYRPVRGQNFPFLVNTKMITYSPKVVIQWLMRATTYAYQVRSQCPLKPLQGCNLQHEIAVPVSIQLATELYKLLMQGMHSAKCFGICIQQLLSAFDQAQVHTS